MVKVFGPLVIRTSLGPATTSTFCAAAPFQPLKRTHPSISSIFSRGIPGSFGAAADAAGSGFGAEQPARTARSTHINALEKLMTPLPFRPLDCEIRVNER